MLQTFDTDVLAVLAESRLLDDSQFEEITGEQERSTDPRELLRLVTLKGWLTAYQANQLLLGRGGELRVGPYRLLERLGEGGMGEVFKARHDGLKRIVALKVVGKKHLANERMLERFRREAEAAARLTHPNIVTLYDAGQVGDTHFLAMEYMEGVDLGRLLESTGPLPLAQACDYARQAALGLHHAHERGLVHRDVKPANLFVQPPTAKGRTTGVAYNLLATQGTASLYAGGVLKLLDLGMARLHNPFPNPGDGQITREGVLVGTLDYVAPEQSRDSHRVDGRADLYSLGCTLYHLLTGTPPFGEFNGIDKIIQHISTPAPSLRTRRPELPEPLAALVARLMAKRPEDRYQKAGDVAEALVLFTRANDTSDFGQASSCTETATTLFAPTVEMPVAPPDLPGDTKTQPASPTTALRTRSAPLRFAVRAAVVAVGVTLLGALLRFGTPTAMNATHVPPPPAYLPEDTCAVLAVNARELWAAPIVRKLERTGTVDYLTCNRVGGHMPGQLHFDPKTDVDRIRAIYGADRFDRPLYWANGRFRTDRFALEANHLEGLDAGQYPPFSFYRSTGPEGQSTTLAADDTTLVCCRDGDRVRAALHDALAGHQPRFQVEGFQDVLARADQQQTIWFAAAMTPYHLLTPTIDQELAHVLAPLFDHAEFVYGGIQFKEDVTGVLYARAIDLISARVLEEQLNQLKLLCKKCAGETTTARRLQPLVRCLAVAKVTRDGKDVTVTFRMTPEMAD